MATPKLCRSKISEFADEAGWQIVSNETNIRIYISGLEIEKQMSLCRSYGCREKYIKKTEQDISIMEQDINTRYTVY